MTQLTLKKIKELKTLGPSKTSDGRGLSFVIPKRGEPYWSLRYSFYGKRRELTLGKDSELSLAEARAQAEAFSKSPSRVASFSVCFINHFI